jgi:hypothetical protein
VRMARSTRAQNRSNVRKLHETGISCVSRRAVANVSRKRSAARAHSRRHTIGEEFTLLKKFL